MKPRYVHQIPEVQSPFRSYCLQFSPCAKYLACGSDGIVVILQVERGMMKELLRIDLVQSHSAIFSPGEQILSICWIRSPITGGLGNLLCGTQSGLIVLISPGTEDPLLSPWRAHDGAVECISEHPYLSVVATGSGRDIIIWDHGNSSGFVQRLVLNKGHNDDKELIVRRLTFSGTLNTIVAAYLYHGFVEWDISSGKRLGVNPVLSPARIGYADFDVSTNAWIYSDMHRGFRMLPWVGQWFGDESTITSDPLPVAYAQDGSAIVGCTKDGRVKLWSRLDGSEVQILAVDQARNQPLDALATASGTGVFNSRVSWRHQLAVSGITERNGPFLSMWYWVNIEEPSIQMQKGPSLLFSLLAWATAALCLALVFEAHFSFPGSSTLFLNGDQ